MPSAKYTCTVALLGNPNSGKTTLFNAWTNEAQRVGNWPGVTVKRMEGLAECSGDIARIVDLPGIYALNTYTPEERIARDYLNKGEADVVVCIADATTLRRSLYLPLEAIQMDKPVLLLLNMMDVAQREKINVDIYRLSQRLNVPVMPISALHKEGVQEALRTALSLAEKPKEACDSCENPGCAHRHSLPQMNDAQARYAFIDEVVDDCVRVERRTGSKSAADRIDALMTHKVLAIPIFLLVMLLTFALTFGIGRSFLGQAIENLFQNGVVVAVESALGGAGASEWLIALISGALTGVGGVLVFLPQIMVLFLCLGILEDSGYMARIAFILDSIFKRFGLSGNSSVILLMGFGCTVPAMMAARTLRDSNARRRTILMTPFMSCSARIPLYTLLVGIFFPKYTALVMLGLYVLGILVGFFTAWLFYRPQKETQTSPFLLEMPPYRMIAPRNVFRHMWQSSKEFLKRAGSIIFCASLIIALLQATTPHLTFAAQPDDSILSHIGRWISGFFGPLGFSDWRLCVALLCGLAAKEAVVSTLYVLFTHGGVAFASALQTVLTPAAALAYMVFVLLYTPCIAATVTMHRELQSGKWTAIAIAYQICVAYVLAMAVFTAARLLFVA